MCKRCDRNLQWQLKSLKWSSDLYDFSSAVFLHVISDTVPCETSMPHLDAVRSDRGGNWEMIKQPLKLIWKPAAALIQRRQLKVTGSGCDVQVSLELYCGPLFFFPGHFGESLNMDVPVVDGEMKWSDGRAVKMLYRKVSVGGNSSECNRSHVRLSLCCTLNRCNCAVETASNCNKGNFYTFLHKPAQMTLPVPVSCRAYIYGCK